MTEKKRINDSKVVDEIRTAGFGVNADDARIDAKNKKDKVPYDPKGDTRNRENTVSNR
jgi:hypothetical protein